MLCRAVLTAVAISYLICVLWLSGMQKEDLDVNMLRKLQRHNVNIDDMSSKTFKQQCLYSKNDKFNTTKEVKDKGDDDENTTTTEYIILDNVKDVKKLKNDLNMMFTDIMDTKTKKTIKNKTSSKKKEVNSKEKILEINIGPSQNTDVLDSLKGADKTDVIDRQYDNAEPVLRSLIWQMFSTTPKSNNYLETLEKTFSDIPIPDEELPEQRFNKPKTKAKQSKHADYINKLLADFMFENTKTTTETPTSPTTSSVDLKKLSDKIEKLLQIYPQSKTLDQTKPAPLVSEVKVIKDPQPYGYYYVKNGIQPVSSILDARIKQYDERTMKTNITKVNNKRLLPIDFPKYPASLPIRVTVQSKPESVRNVEIINDMQPYGYYYDKNGNQAASSILNERIKQYDERNINNNQTKYNNKSLRPIDFPKYPATLPISVPLQSKLAPVGDVEIINDMQPIGYYYVKNGIQAASSILDERIKHYDQRNIKNDVTKEYNNKQILPIDFPQYPASFPTRVPVQALDYKQEMVERHQSIHENTINFEPIYGPKTNNTKTSNNVSKTNAEKIITKDCIKEIAENVKALVMKDLRKEITTVPVSTSIATTTIIPTTTSSSTISPTTGVTRERLPQNNTQDANQVIAKFMELFEQLNIMKQKTEIKSNTNDLPKNVTRQEIVNSFNINYQAPTSVVDPYKVKKPPENTLGLYASKQRTPSPRPVQNLPRSAKIVSRAPQPRTPLSYSRMQSKPITMQTNSDEIRPLGIPILKPPQVIHQNIIVTTTTSVTTTRYQRKDKWVDHYQHKDKRIHSKPRMPNTDISGGNPHKSRLDEFENLFQIKTENTFVKNLYKDDRLGGFKHLLKDDKKSIDQRPHNARPRELKKTFTEDRSELGQKFYEDDRSSEFRDDKLLDRRPYENEKNRGFDAKPSHQKFYENPRYSISNNSNREKSTYDDLLNLKLNENKKDYGNEQKHNSDSISYGIVSHKHNSQRFHEKLERVDDWRDESRGNAEGKKMNVQVAPRQQQPLHMGDSRFDDTHFKNFLKTQQKVNDMLEKILSSKSMSGGPRSVETT